MKHEISEKNLTPVFGKKKTCFGILSIIKQTLTNVLLGDFSSFNKGVLPKRKTLPKKEKIEFMKVEIFCFTRLSNWIFISIKPKKS